MYKDHKKKNRMVLLVLLIGLLLFGAYSFWNFHREDKSEVMQSMKDSILDRALQCYVVEGVYPPSLEYLEENYGLVLNKTDYYIHYDIFAENLPPDVRITERNR